MRFAGQVLAVQQQVMKIWESSLQSMIENDREGVCQIQLELLDENGAPRRVAFATFARCCQSGCAQIEHSFAAFIVAIWFPPSGGNVVPPSFFPPIDVV